MHKHLSNRLGICYQDSRFIEQPAIIQHTIVRHIIDPVSLRFTCRVFVDASKVPKQEMRVLTRCQFTGFFATRVRSLVVVSVAFSPSKTRLVCHGVHVYVPAA
jgi:hypothetical protein